MGEDKVQNRLSESSMNVKIEAECTVEIHILNLYVLDWATAMAGEAYRELTHVSFT